MALYNVYLIIVGATKQDIGKKHSTLRKFRSTQSRNNNPPLPKYLYLSKSRKRRAK